jgi:hypothetical protein
MKTALLVASFLCATAALGQSIGSAVGSPTMSNPVPMVTHDQQAYAHPMAQEHNLLGGSGGVYIAQGERPLWEVAPPDPPYIPLGDTARKLKKQHESAKKAQFVFEN